MSSKKKMPWIRWAQEAEMKYLVSNHNIVT